MKIAILILTLFLISFNAGDPKTDTDNIVPDKVTMVNFVITISILRRNTA